MLVEAMDDDFAALLAGHARAPLRLVDGNVATAAELSMLRDLARSVAPVFRPAAWMFVEDDEVVGLCSVLRVGDAGHSIDIGYGVAALAQGRGVGGRAIAEVVRWALGDKRVDAVTADTAVANIASQRMLERAGFARVGERVDDEDGSLICWRVETGV